MATRPRAKARELRDSRASAWRYPVALVLSYLRIRGLALIDDVALELSPGMNVLTGETGAGKSIIVGALSLLRGARARADLVRTGEDAAVVEGRFDPPPAVEARVTAVLEDLGMPSDLSEGLVLRRSVSAGGRSRSFVQDSPTTLAGLSRVAEMLIDICSQHEHHFLTHRARHLDVLDAYAGLDDERTEYLERHGAWRAVLAEQEALATKTAERLQRADYLRFVVEELENAAPEPGEYEALRGRVGLLQDVQHWASFAEEARLALYESDDAIAGRLAAMADLARGGADQADELGEIAEQLTAAQLACEEAARSAERLADAVVVEPGELDQAQARLSDLEALRRKHGVEPDALAERLATMRQELDALDGAEQRAEALADEEARRRAACLELAAVLHQRRTAAAEGLGTAVQGELAALHMAKAEVAVTVEVPEPDVPGPLGIDRVELMLAANPGEPPAPLSRVASGGELSRVLLAIKGVLAAEDRVATYVFDEVDAGVGGRIADAIGKRLGAAARTHQVLCVTHLPAIAAQADAHLRVGKSTRKGRTTTRVESLQPDDRIDEIARMLGGAVASARPHAERLIVDAKKGRKRAPSRRRASH